MIDGFLEGQRESGFISATEQATLQEKTYRQLRLREMLLEHSKQSNLIVMSLPMPRQVSLIPSFQFFIKRKFMLTNLF